MRFLIFLLFLSAVVYSQGSKNPVTGVPGSDMPAIEPGVSQELAKWRAANYSDVRYKLNLTLEKMSPVLKGTMEIRVKLTPQAEPPASAGGGITQTETRPAVPTIILDWRKIRGHEAKSTIANVTVNGKAAKGHGYDEIIQVPDPALNQTPPLEFVDWNEHLVFPEGIVTGENVIKLDFTSPILTSGSAITRYIDKEDGSEYLYSLFVPSDASAAFPVFDQPDLKARFWLTMHVPHDWKAIANQPLMVGPMVVGDNTGKRYEKSAYRFLETKPISTYVFAFAAGPFEKFDGTGGNLSDSEGVNASPRRDTLPIGRVSASGAIYVRKSQAAKFKPHAEEVFRLNREAVKYFEQYFDYKFPFPKYDMVLIPEFPFGGMEHAGATFLRESSIIFPQEPTKNDHINRATLIFHEAAHQWFGDTVTMRWFDDLWLKEGFATFMGYKALEKIIPEMNAWKVFYERIKQGAYQTDSTKGTTAIYQPIANLSAAKSAYGNIVYNKAPAFLRQAEFYLGEDKFQTAVRAFLNKHEYANAGWEDLVNEFENSSWENRPKLTAIPVNEQQFRENIRGYLTNWVKQRGMPRFRNSYWEARPGVAPPDGFWIVKPFQSRDFQENALGELNKWGERVKYLGIFPDGSRKAAEIVFSSASKYSGDSPTLYLPEDQRSPNWPLLIFPNYQDYGYGIFLLDDKSRDFVLKNIQNEKDPFLRSMMWGALWDSVREGELDPREYVELVVRVQSASFSSSERDKSRTLNTDDESTVALLLNRVGTAMNYYIDTAAEKSGGKPAFPTAIGKGDLLTAVEDLLIERMQNAETLGQRITFYRAFLNIASSENARKVLKDMLKGGNPSGSEGVSPRPNKNTLPIGRVSASASRNARVAIPLKSKDRFDIVTRLLILNDPEAPKLLSDLEKTETSDDAKRYAYAAKAGIPTAENKAKYWNDFTNNKEISESWIEAAFGPWNSIRHSELTLPYLQKALQELPNHKRNRKIFFVNGWLGAFIGGQRSEEALNIVNKFLADNQNLDRDLRLKVLENVDLIERAVKIRNKYSK